MTGVESNRGGGVNYSFQNDAKFFISGGGKNPVSAQNHGGSGAKLAKKDSSFGDIEQGMGLPSPTYADTKPSRRIEQIESNIRHTQDLIKKLRSTHKKSIRENTVQYKGKMAAMERSFEKGHNYKPRRFKAGKVSPSIRNQT